MLEGYYLESLRQYCETGTGKPFQLPPKRRTAHSPAQARLLMASGRHRRSATDSSLTAQKANSGRS
jgi:hypothetical protein